MKAYQSPLPFALLPTWAKLDLDYDPDHTLDLIEAGGVGVNDHPHHQRAGIGGLVNPSVDIGKRFDLVGDGHLTPTDMRTVVSRDALFYFFFTPPSTLFPPPPSTLLPHPPPSLSSPLPPPTPPFTPTSTPPPSLFPHPR